jgi:hypothetical protein
VDVIIVKALCMKGWKHFPCRNQGVAPSIRSFAPPSSWRFGSNGIVTDETRWGT